MAAGFGEYWLREDATSGLDVERGSCLGEVWVSISGSYLSDVASFNSPRGLPKKKVYDPDGVVKLWTKPKLHKRPLAYVRHNIVTAKQRNSICRIMNKRRK